MLFSRRTNLSPLADRRKNQRSDEVRRRPDKIQGRALEILGHALEYLIDTTLCSGYPASKATIEAVELIAGKSRAIFRECPEILTLSQRITRLFPRCFSFLRGNDPLTLSPLHHSSVDKPPKSR